MAQTIKSEKPVSWLRWLAWGSASLLMLGLVLAIGIVVALKIGVSSSFLATKIQDSLNARLNGKAQFVLSNAYLLLDNQFHLHLESRDVNVDVSSGNAHLDKIGSVRIGVALMPLLQGKLNISQMQVNDVNVTLVTGQRAAAGQGRGFLQQLPQDGVGRIDFDALSNLLFLGFNRGMEVVEQQALEKISLERVVAHFSFRGKRKQIDVKNLTVKREAGEHETGLMQLSGRIGFDGQEMRLEGEAHYDARIGDSNLQLQLAQMPLYLGVEEGILPYWEDGTVRSGYFRLKGLSDARFDAVKTKSEQKIRLEIELPQGEVELADVSDLAAGAKLVLEHQLAGNGVQILPSQLAIDRVAVDFHGLLAPLAPPELPLSLSRKDLSSDSEMIEQLAQVADIEGKYAFELFFDKGVISHPTTDGLDFSAQLSGVLALLERKITFEEMSLQSETGLQIQGQGSLRFAPPAEGRLFIGKETPEAIFNLEVPAISLQEVQQLWPFNIASSARLWVLRQIESGQIHQGRLHLNLPLDFYYKGKPRQALSEKELKITGELESVYAHLIGDLPHLENFAASLDISGQEMMLRQGRGEIFIDENARPQRPLRLNNVGVDVTRPLEGTPVTAMRFHLAGEGGDMLRLIGRHPINVGDRLPFNPVDFSGQLQAETYLQFPLALEGEEKIAPDQIDWRTIVDFHDVALTLALDSGGKVSEAQGQATIDKNHFSLNAQAKLDGMDTSITMAGATDNASVRDEKITLLFDDAARERLLPALSAFVSGQAAIEIGPERDGAREFDIDLSQAIVEVPWLGWKKGAGIAAQAKLRAKIDKNNSRNIVIEDFLLQGESFLLEGEVDIRDGSLAIARFHQARLNRGDDISFTLEYGQAGYHIKVSGKKFDMRSFIKSANIATAQGQMQGEAVVLELDIARVSGFYDEYFDNFKASFKRNRAGDEEVYLSAQSSQGQPIDARLTRQGKMGEMHVVSNDGGALLRFADFYDKVQGGTLDLKMQLDENAAWSGPLSLNNFQIVDEPRLARIVASPPPDGGRSLNDVAGGKINVSRLDFDRAFGQIVRGKNFLALERGILRGPTVGTTLQGIVYDAAGNVSMTGTFMPAYGVNRLFSNVPVLGNILGNGRDRGLIGLTFKVDGKAKNPRIIVNPLSVIAPGVFRQIFEFH